MSEAALPSGTVRMSIGGKFGERTSKHRMRAPGLKRPVALLQVACARSPSRRVSSMWAQHRSTDWPLHPRTEGITSVVAFIKRG
jgi:hypothetical protein